MHIKFLKRENFKLSENDYLLRVDIVNGDFKTGQETAGLTPEKRDIKLDYLSIHFVTFHISKNIYSEYKIKLSNEFLRVNFQKFGPPKKSPEPKQRLLADDGPDYKTQNGVLDILNDEKTYVKTLTIDKKYAKDNDFYIYDDVKYRLVKKTERDIWMILESKDANNYILRYPKSLLVVDKSKHGKEEQIKNVNPLSWRIDNPYFGKANGAGLQPTMVDWLYVLPKIESDQTHLIFYVIPEERLIDEDGKKVTGETENSKNMILFSKRVLVLDDVVDYDVKMLDFEPVVCKYFFVVFFGFFL